jgi:hypothetical protein
VFKDGGAAAYEVGHSEVAGWRNRLHAWNVAANMLNKQ